MYVYIQKNKSGDIVYLCENLWDKNKKHSVRKITCRLGKLDDLTKDNPKAIEELRKQYRSKEEQSRIKKATSVLSGKPIDSGRVPLLQYGFFPLRRIWDKLTLKYRVNYLKENQTKIEFDVERVLFNLVASRIIAPNSNLKTWLESSDKLNDPFKDIDLQHLYRTLSFVEMYSEDLMKTVHEKLKKENKRDCSVVFYDVTNAWFETSYTDKERAEMEIARKLGALGDRCTRVQQEKIFEEVGEKYPELLRMRGFSKEHRNDCPLVSLALLVDKNQIPIDYKVYPGNMSEKKTMVDMINEIKKEYEIKGAVVVADRGLNSYENIKANIETGYGVIVSQSIEQLPEETKKLIKEKKQWDYIGNTQIKIGEFELKKEDSRPIKKVEKGSAIGCRLIVTWSPVRASRDLMKLEQDIQRAKQDIAKGNSIIKRSTSWQRLIKKPSDSNQTKAQKLDEAAIKERRESAGYYAIIYHDPAGLKNKLNAVEIVEQYRHLVGIEDCFRVMKSVLDLRPLYVRTAIHVRGAIGVCVLSLVLLRMLEMKLRSKNTPLTMEQIVEGLNDAKIVPIETSEGYCFQPVEDNKISSAEWKQYCEKEEVKKLPPLIDQIMEACELTPITSIVTVPGLSRALRTRLEKAENLIPQKKRQLKPRKKAKTKKEEN